MVHFFFFKQKTAYEMRISDWSSDVCSSDLAHPQLGAAVLGLDRQNEPDVADLLALHLLGEGEVEFEAAGGVVGRADIKQAREVGKEFGHRKAPETTKPGAMAGFDGR